MDLVAEYDYGLAIKGRFRLADGSKTFRWRLRDSREWSGLGKQLTEAELPLYRATELARRYEVLVVEGEAACDACWDHGLAATTVCGGAAQKQFGEALRILESKWVILWPDNDDAGRGLMRRLAEDIDGTAKVVTIAPPVPSKGDAVDYFARGGQPENLIALAKRAAQGPQVEMHGAGGILKLPESGGFVCVSFEAPARSRGQHECEVEIWQEIPGVTHERFYGRLGLSSISGRSEFRRSLEETLGKAPPWAAHLNTATRMIRQTVADARQAKPLNQARRRSLEAMLLDPWVPDGRPSILFGRGELAKSTLAIRIGIAVGTGEEFLDSQGGPMPVLFVDYEADEAEILGRAELFGPVPESFHYMNAMGEPFHELLPQVRKEVARAEIGFIIVDSAGLACGGEPEKAEGAIRYFNALNSLGLSSLTTAHVTKEDTKELYPFGSIFWHNGARLTWNVQGDRDLGVLHLGFFCRKANTLRERPHSFGLAIEGGHIRREAVRDYFGHLMPLRDQLRALLLQSGKTRRQLEDATGADGKTISKTLSRMDDVGKIGGTYHEPIYGIVSDVSPT